MQPILLIALLLLTKSVLAEDGPMPPCAGPALPGYALLDAEPRAQIWKGGVLTAGWRPAPCTAWPSAKPKLLVAVAGRFRTAAGVDAILARFAAVSELVDVRYWSVTDRQWQRLFLRSYALNGPDAAGRRPDFTVDEFKLGQPLYFMEKDNRSSNDVIYSVTVRVVSAHSLVIEMENITPVRFYVIQLYPAQTLRSLYFFDEGTPGVWDYYSLLDVGADASLLALNSDASYLNRANALFRHFAGLQMDSGPPPQH